jgi:hypothetical protein
MFEPKGAGHTAAAGVEEGDVSASAAEEVDLVRHFHGGFVMAVTVEDDFLPQKAGGPEVRRLLNEELAEKEGVVAKALCARVAWKEVDQFVAKDGCATGLEKDEGEACIDLRREIAKNFLEVGASLFQEAEVVERAAAADMVARDLDRKSGGIEDAGGGGEGLWMVVVVPRIGP